MQSSEISKLMSCIAMGKMRTGHAPMTARLAELLFPLIIPIEGFGASECAALAEIELANMEAFQHDPARRYHRGCGGGGGGCCGGGGGCGGCCDCDGGC